MTQPSATVRAATPVDLAAVSDSAIAFYTADGFTIDEQKGELLHRPPDAVVGSCHSWVPGTARFIRVVSMSCLSGQGKAGTPEASEA